MKKLLLFGALLFGAVLTGAPRALADPFDFKTPRFDFEALRNQAWALASKPYAQETATVPPWLRSLNYDQYRDIRFKPSESHWLRDGLPFQIQFFHPGFFFDKPVTVNELRDGIVRRIPFSRHDFDYGANTVGPLPSSMGFAGFRLLYPLNKPGDELGSFLGASYLRFLCQKAVYGLSARGLAVNTGEPGGEEFPVFKEFWIERPDAQSSILTVYALLDSPHVAGAYRFEIAPGADTVLTVHAVLYCRQNPAVLGIAPLTSMFWHGENSNEETDDFRPEVHDSDGLMLWLGDGEWLWRPLTNPHAMREAAFSDVDPHGFGLIQRDRSFGSYQDQEAAYNQRPSTWVEPIGSWGAGSIRLLELPTPDETNDNIVAFWAPASLPPAGEPIEVRYRMHWFLDQIHTPAGYTVSTRHGRSRTHEPDLERFMVDFDGPYLGKEGQDPAIQPVVTVGQGGVFANATIEKNPVNGTWRVAFAFRPDGSGHPVELRCFLAKPPHVLTETWTYLWQP